MMSTATDFIFRPTPALDASPLSPPDGEGRRWRSRVRECLKGRGEGDLAGLRAYLAAVAMPPAIVQRIEAGVEPPSAAYRAAAAAVLGMPEESLFEFEIA